MLIYPLQAISTIFDTKLMVLLKEFLEMLIQYAKLYTQLAKSFKIITKTPDYISQNAMDKFTVVLNLRSNSLRQVPTTQIVSCDM